MTTPDLSAIEARLAAATPGPWVLDYEACDCGDGYGCAHGRWPYQIRNAHHQQMTGSPEVEAANVCAGWPGCEIEHRHAASELAEMTDADAELIAHAPTDIAALLAYVEELEAERDDRMAIADLNDKIIGVVTVTPISGQRPVLHGAYVAEYGYMTPIATVQDAADRAVPSAILCLLVPVDQDGAVL